MPAVIRVYGWGPFRVARQEVVGWTIGELVEIVVVISDVFLRQWTKATIIHSKVDRLGYVMVQLEDFTGCEVFDVDRNKWYSEALLRKVPVN